MVSGDKSEATADCSARSLPVLSSFQWQLQTPTRWSLSPFTDSSYFIVRLPGFHLSTPVSVFTNADHEMRCLNPNSHFTFLLNLFSP